MNPDNITNIAGANKTQLERCCMVHRCRQPGRPANLLPAAPPHPMPACLPLAPPRCHAAAVLFMWVCLPAFGAASYVPAIVLERPLFVRWGAGSRGPKLLPLLGQAWERAAVASSRMRFGRPHTLPHTPLAPLARPCVRLAPPPTRTA